MDVITGLSTKNEWDFYHFSSPRFVFFQRTGRIIRSSFAVYAPVVLGSDLDP